MPGQVRKTVLANRVCVLSEHMPGVRSVSVGALVAVGPKDEQPAERGFSHLIEHMVFQGTGMRTAGDIAEMMAIGGGAMGAFTAREYTVYHGTVLDDYVTFALEVLGDMLGDSILPEAALERQRRVILNELLGDDDPLERANDLLKAAMWPDHPLGYSVAGNPASVRAATRAALVDFMQRHYIAPKLILSAAGNINHARFVELVRDSFWQMNGTPFAPADLGAPRFKSGVVIADPRDYQQVYFTLAWPAPAYVDPQRYAWHIFANLLGGGPTSRLYRRLREELGLVYHITAQYQAYGTTGALIIEGATPPAALIPVLANVLIELYRMLDEPVNPDHYQHAVQSLISQHLIASDSPYVRMSRLALQELYFKDSVPSDHIIDGLQAQSIEAITQVAQPACWGGLPSLALVGPVTEDLLAGVGAMLADFGDDELSLTFASRPDFQAGVDQVE